MWKYGFLAALRLSQISLLVLSVTSCGEETDSLRTLPSCEPGQSIVWDGTEWLCQNSEPCQRTVASSGGPDSSWTLASCGPGQSVVWDGTAWDCEDPPDGTIDTCGQDQIMAWNGTLWVCRNVPSDTNPACDPRQVVVYIDGGWKCGVVVSGESGFIDIPRDTLADLAESVDSALREGVASNSSTPASVLASLAADSVSSVRGSLAYNRNTPTSNLAYSRNRRVKVHSARVAGLRQPIVASRKDLD